MVQLTAGVLATFTVLCSSPIPNACSDDMTIKYGVVTSTAL